MDSVVNGPKSHWLDGDISQWHIGKPFQDGRKFSHCLDHDSVFVLNDCRSLLRIQFVNLIGNRNAGGCPDAMLPGEVFQ